MNFYAEEKNPFSRSMAKESHDNIVIDVDSYTLDDVIIIDDTESVTKKFQGPNLSTHFRKGQMYIYIDGCDSDTDSHSTSRTFPSSSSRQHFVDLDGGQSQAFHGKQYAFAMKKCRRSNYREAPARNHSCSCIVSDSNSSESDSSDCELMEASVGKLQKQWKEASLRRKRNVHSAYRTVDDQAKSSPSPDDSDSSFDVNNQMKQHSEAEACSSSGNAGNTSSLVDELKKSSSKSCPLTPHAVKDIICERERLKETDEYKRAMEEERIARQQQLQVQADEARRLRRKKKADRMRLLNMQKRQMLRLEEVRETQKKDEENISLKEQLRVDVRKELRKLEMTCTDMASLLRGLGILVGCSFHPSSQEVQAAYKKALLKFHPDRVSKTDLRLQVEAEEKFKLIADMKKKLCC